MSILSQGTYLQYVYYKRNHVPIRDYHQCSAPVVFDGKKLGPIYKMNVKEG